MKEKNKKISKLFTIYLVEIENFESITVLKKNFPLFDFQQKKSHEILDNLENKNTKIGLILNCKINNLEEVITKLNEIELPFALLLKKPSDAIYGFRKNAIYCIEAPITIEKLSLILLKMQSFFLINS